MFKKVAFVAISLGVQTGELADGIIAENVADACFHVSVLFVSLVLVLMALQEEVERVD